ncbi:MAG: large subunit ribosomal protein [Candidatus Cloacimonadota bacterium]|jgi:large subunit ribosomal protein L22|nr:large subunit ribosomal protein [Candidatus Cloacimonadota bacterium]
MEAKARVRNLRGSARKARLVLDLIRGKSVPEAQKILFFSKKRVAADVAKLLNSALANAEHKEGKFDTENMFVSTAFADDGPIMRRYRPRAQGRATIIRRRTCHITLEIMDREKE